MPRTGTLDFRHWQLAAFYKAMLAVAVFTRATRLLARYMLRPISVCLCVCLSQSRRSIEMDERIELGILA